jgi:GrpB-like predicted nucleotidyltransferase (UPF0157 family)
MKKNLHELSTEELGKLFPIKIEPSNPGWAGLFDQEKQNLEKLLGTHVALRIEHFGSTAIPNISAKPTLDILVEIPKNMDINDEIINTMKLHTYDYILRKDCPPPYMMFLKGYTPHGFEGQCYHIHMGPAIHTGLWDRLYFRDYLRDNEKAAKEYELLKIELAGKYTYDREKYTEGKADFIEKVTTIAKQKYKIPPRMVSA